METDKVQENENNMLISISGYEKEINKIKQDTSKMMSENKSDF